MEPKVEKPKAAKKAVTKKAPAKKVPLLSAAEKAGAVVKKAVGVHKPRVKKVELIEAVAEVVAAPEPPVPEKRDFTEAKKKWQLGDIDNMKYMPRDEFVQSVLGDIGGKTVEEAIAVSATPGALAEELRALSKNYIVLRDTGARLPKFSKWVTSMYADKKDLHVVLAREAQAATDKRVHISGDIVDLLRLADTTHYWSCLAANGMYKEVTRAIVERCPGIFIAYVDGDDGKMKGRIFLNHGKIKDKDVVFAAGHLYGNGFTLTQLADYFADLGVEFYQYAYGGTEITPVNCFGKDDFRIHYDTPTWNATLGCKRIPPSAEMKKAA